MTVITNNRGRAILAGIGLTLLATGAAAVSLLGATTPGAARTAQAGPLPMATTTITAPLLPQATITKSLPQATVTKTAPARVITKTVKVPQATITCGHAEDDCYPDYIGKGRWVIRHGERPMPKATKSVEKGKQSTGGRKKVPGATIPGVCKHPSITRAMIKDCIALAARPKVVAEGKYEIPAGRVLVKECTDQYRGEELASCLKQ